MGNTQSERRELPKSGMRYFLISSSGAADESDLILDVGIDSSLVKYSGLNSAAELESSVTQVLQDAYSKIPDFVQSLGSALAAFEKIPNAVGLGAVALSIVLEIMIMIMTQEESKDSTQDMLRRVFAEEKASGVRDLMEEYLKRLRMYAQQPDRALEETERLEKQLSEQLTRLKNSMLYDKQMSSRSMKHWTNGAAFHLQMLIHAARLKTQSSTEEEAQLQVHLASITAVLNCYQADLEELLKQYKTYAKSTISLSHHVEFQAYRPIKDEELERETPFVPFMPGDLFFPASTDEYVDYMFDNCSKLKELKSYFSDLKENLQELIKQNYEFNIQKVLPVSDSQET